MTPSPLFAPLADWFAQHRRPLPWREPSTSAWGVLLSEIMAQQTPVARVEGPWRAWMQRWPTPAALAEATSAEVLRAWGSLGYPRRALRLHECAEAIVRDFDGEVPGTEAELRALPGIGEYTAAAVASFAFHRRALVLDTNVRRVIARAVGGHEAVPAHLAAPERARAAELLPEDAHDSVLWNEGCMELGALVCTSRRPRCEACPLAAQCAWLAAGSPAAAPHERPRRQGFEGTDRQVRGRIMKRLREQSPAPGTALAHASGVDFARYTSVLAGLLHDGLVHESAEQIYALGPAPSR